MSQSPSSSREGDEWLKIFPERAQTQMMLLLKLAGGSRKKRPRFNRCLQGSEDDPGVSWPNPEVRATTSCLHRDRAASNPCIKSNPTHKIHNASGLRDFVHACMGWFNIKRSARFSIGLSSQLLQRLSQSGKFMTCLRNRVSSKPTLVMYGNPDSKQKEDCWEYASVVEHVYNLGSVPNTLKLKKKTKRQKLANLVML